MSEQMDFGDGKYTVINDNGRLEVLCYGQPWRHFVGDKLVYLMLTEAIKLKEERDALAAKLKELEGQELVAYIDKGTGRPHWLPGALPSNLPHGTPLHSTLAPSPPSL